MSKDGKRKIVIVKSRHFKEILDCPVCKLAIRDWDDYISCRSFNACTECKENKPNTSHN